MLALVSCNEGVVDVVRCRRGEVRREGNGKEWKLRLWEGALLSVGAKRGRSNSASQLASYQGDTAKTSKTSNSW